MRVNENAYIPLPFGVALPNPTVRGKGGGRKFVSGKVVLKSNTRIASRFRRNDGYRFKEINLLPARATNDLLKRAACASVREGEACCGARDCAGLIKRSARKHETEK